ncbi:MAG: DUF445 family protein [Syntrophomonadaceae bacterium]|nr:DUF445 family protein [Syntrophomonadaceae bacterium]
MYQYAVIPVLSALIGYLTNVIAIKLLFWPHKPINLLLFQLHGLLPKRKAEVATSVGKLVEEQLLSIDDVLDNIDTPEMRARLFDKVNEALRERLNALLPRILPSQITNIIKDSIERILRQEAHLLIDQVLHNDRDYITQGIEINRMVEEKINSFDVTQLEQMIKKVSSSELRFIEVLGGVIGMIIGILQVGLLILISI